MIAEAYIGHMAHEWLTYGVSVGDYFHGLRTRAYRNGITAEDHTFATFEDVMLHLSDDRRYDATVEQWFIAYMEFQRGFAHAQTLCDNCTEADPSTTLRDHGMHECDRCWRESLKHGHLHGMHETPVEGCPACTH